VFNVGTPELLVILLVALIVLGPDKLPNAARQVGRYLGEFRRMSSGFQTELRDALQEPVTSVTETLRSDPVPKATPAPRPAEPDDRAGAEAGSDVASDGPGPDPDAVDVAEAAAADPSSVSWSDADAPAAAAEAVDREAGEPRTAEDGEATAGTGPDQPGVDAR
jgi:sec-independent protein translocase protein TatB